jgi:hypothetical protein
MDGRAKKAELKFRPTRLAPEERPCWNEVVSSERVSQQRLRPGERAKRVEPSAWGWGPTRF